MAHPLNRPRFGRARGATCVVDGYGILQPRVGLSLPSTNRSGYARLYGGEPGIDPYTRAVSDVYQDLFGEGSFVGKGIYDVDAFERALRRPPAREPHPQPRPARRLLRALRPAQRRAAARGIADALQRRRGARATAGSAATGSCSAGCARRAARAAAARRAIRCRRCRARRSSTTCAAASCPPACSRAARRLVAAAAAGAVDAGARWRSSRWCRWPRSSPPGCARRCSGCAPSERRAPPRRRPPAAAPAAAGAADARLPAARGGLQPRRHRAHAVALLRRAPPARVAAVGRRVASTPRRAAWPTCCTACARWPSARCWRSPAAPAWRWLRPDGAARRPRRCCCCGCSSPRAGLVDRPPAAAQAPRAERAADAVPAPPGAPHLGLLRCARRRRATTTCRPTTCRSSRWRASRTAPRRPTWASRCSPPWRRATSAIWAPAACWSASTRR